MMIATVMKTTTNAAAEMAEMAKTAKMVKMA
jgi:hypothetical protein